MIVLADPATPVPFRAGTAPLADAAGAAGPPSSITPASAPPKVVVDMNKPSLGPPLVPKRVGGYRSEESNFKDKIYQPESCSAILLQSRLNWPLAMVPRSGPTRASAAKIVLKLM
jgi:hypothetical protein